MSRIGREGMGARARTVSVRRLSMAALEFDRLLYPPTDVDRPQKRADCLPGGSGQSRPCPFVSCRHHLALDVNGKTGAIKENFPGLELEEMPATCALDVAERGGATLDEVGQVMNLTRERVRQLEVMAQKKVAAARDLEEHYG